jgi:hypothetical protein
MPRLLTRTFTTAAFVRSSFGSLKPPPTRRLRRAHLHLSYSMTLSRLLDTTSLRTVLERLRSYGSRPGAPPHTPLPVRPQFRIASRDTRDPMRRPAQMPAQLLIFPIGPAGQRSIQLPHRRIERRPVKPPVILEPASNDRVEHGTCANASATDLRWTCHCVDADSSFESLPESLSPPCRKLREMKNFPLRFFDLRGRNV